ncbi:MAG: hypothetical protein AAGF73_17175 [Actinomycetota bacterium]
MGQLGDQSAHQQSEGDVVSDVWATTADESVDAADDCGPTRVCRNARDFTFDGIADEGEDLPTAWRRLLEREGKISNEASSIRDLVLGAND